MLALEPGGPGFVSTFESSEECLEGAVGAAEYAASDGDFECGPFRQVGAYEIELFHLVDAGYGGALHLPGVSSFSERGLYRVRHMMRTWSNRRCPPLRRCPLSWNVL